VIVAVVVGAVIVVVALAVVLARRRRTPDGVTTFQRQIDALSPEARRPVVQRLEDVSRRNEPLDGPPDSGATPSSDDPRSGGLDGA
jgi:hypothetical protein